MFLIEQFLWEKNWATDSRTAARKIWHESGFTWLVVCGMMVFEIAAGYRRLIVFFSHGQDRMHVISVS